MKKIISVSIISLLFISCYNAPGFKDFDGPVLNEVFYIGEDILFQWDEPVKSCHFFIDDLEIKVENDLMPVANIYFSQLDFAKYQSTGVNNTNMKYKVIDTSGNETDGEMMIPFVNLKPVQFMIKEISLKYSKKKPQYIKIVTLGEGETTGYKMIIFAQRKLYYIPFSRMKLNNNSFITINWNYDKENGALPDEINANCLKDILMPFRLPQSCGLIALIDHSDQILDFIIYYDGKDREFKAYKSASYYKELFNFIERKIETPQFSDISGYSIKKVVKRNNNLFYVDSSSN